MRLEGAFPSRAGRKDLIGARLLPPKALRQAAIGAAAVLAVEGAARLLSRRRKHARIRDDARTGAGDGSVLRLTVWMAEIRSIER